MAATVEFGAFGVDRHLMHPIFQWLDYRYTDYGVFGRIAQRARSAAIAIASSPA